MTAKRVAPKTYQKGGYTKLNKTVQNQVKAGTSTANKIVDANATVANNEADKMAKSANKQNAISYNRAWNKVSGDSRTTKNKISASYAQAVAASNANTANIKGTIAQNQRKNKLSNTVQSYKQRANAGATLGTRKVARNQTLANTNRSNKLQDKSLKVEAKERTLSRRKVSVEKSKAVANVYGTIPELDRAIAAMKKRVKAGERDAGKRLKYLQARRIELVQSEAENNAAKAAAKSSGSGRKGRRGRSYSRRSGYRRYGYSRGGSGSGSDSSNTTPVLKQSGGSRKKSVLDPNLANIVNWRRNHGLQTNEQALKSGAAKALTPAEQLYLMRDNLKKPKRSLNTKKRQERAAVKAWKNWRNRKGSGTLRQSAKNRNLLNKAGRKK